VLKKASTESANQSAPEISTEDSPVFQLSLISVINIGTSVGKPSSRQTWSMWLTSVGSYNDAANSGRDCRIAESQFSSDDSQFHFIDKALDK
jgi:hypothetical protein